jgi:Domain of unknown function (DUF5597)
MKKTSLICFLLISVGGYSQTKSRVAVVSARTVPFDNAGSITVVSLFAQKTEIPHFEKKGNTTQLIVKDKPFLILGGELHNFAGLSSPDKKATTAGGIVFAIGPDEFIVIGKDFGPKFTPLNMDSQKPKIDVEYMDEGTFLNNKWVATRRLNGDEGRGGGDYGFGFSNGKAGFMPFQKQSNDEYSIVRIKFYKY